MFLINNFFLGKIVVTLFVNQCFGADNALEDLLKEASIHNQVMAAHLEVHPSIHSAALKVHLETATAHQTQDHLLQYQLLLDLPNPVHLLMDLLNLLQSPSIPNLHLIPMAHLKLPQIPMDPHKLLPNPPQIPMHLHNQPHFQPVQVQILMAHPRPQSTQLRTLMAHLKLQLTQYLTHMVHHKQLLTQHLIPMALPKQQSTQHLTLMAHPKQHQSTQPQTPMAHLRLLSILLLTLMVHHKPQ